VKPIVLIIEDDPKLAAIYQTVLKQIGYETVLDLNGDQYVAALSTICPTLIILDLHVPFASGVDILKYIRSDPRLMNIPVIVTTADIVLARSVQESAQEVLLKPVSVNRLRQTVQRLCPGDLQSEL
jgi:CheY-like chemotaxis protein